MPNPSRRVVFPVFVVLAAAAPAQQAPPPTEAEQGHANVAPPTVVPPNLAPLCTGAVWTYAVTEHDGTTVRRSLQTVTDEGPYSLPGGGTVHRLRLETSRPAAVTFTCWSTDAFGVHEHVLGDAGRRGTIDVAAAPALLLSVPLDAGATWRCGAHTATLVDAAAEVLVPAGRFTTAHVRIDGPAPRELWFADGVGLVRERRVDGERREVRELTAFAPGADTRRERLLAHLDELLGKGHVPAFNNTPWIGWIDRAPEAMVLPGHVAVVKTETWSRCWYVDAHGCHAFEPREADRIALAARAAFGTDTALPPADVPAEALALLLARTWAERLHLANVTRAAEVTLTARPLLGDSPRRAAVQVAGGAPDGTERRVAVWLSLDRSSDVQVATDADDPWPVR